MRLLIRLLFAMLLAVIHAAPAAAQSLHSVVDNTHETTLDDFEETGKTRRCLNFMKLERLKAITDRELLFVERGELYRNVPVKPCRGATDFRNRFNFTSSGGRICRGSNLVIQSRSSGKNVGVCSLGEFKLLKLKQVTSAASADGE